MSDRRWYRSLYWRIGLAFFVLLALILVSQAASFVWIAVQTEVGRPERMGRDFAELVATDFESARAGDPAFDLKAYARTRLAEFHRPAFVVFADGEIIGPAGEPLPPELERIAGLATRRLNNPEADPPRRRRPRMADDGPLDRLGVGPLGPPPFGDRPRFASAPVRVDGQTTAVVFVTPALGARRIARELGPWLAVGALLLLVGGTAVAALVVFRPAHTELRALEEAAKRFGEGDLEARAPVAGGDEVAAVAQAFNQMAGDLATRQAQLEDADRARRQLLADVSHELMTPLTAIRGYAETLTLPQFGPEAPEGRRSVQIIQQEVERIERLVGDLLDLARYEGGLSLVTSRFRVQDLLNRVVERHEGAAREKSVTIDIRQPDSEMTIVGDLLRLEQAVQNLASNALRHTPAGGHVTLAAEVDNERIRLSVTDTGAGIPAEHLPHVFDRFYKADPARHAGGSGLGLSVVKAIVERHGGRVSARSVPGVETVFEIDLPRSGPPDVA